MTNIKKAQTLLSHLYIQGMREFVICPGGRNAPFVEALEKLKDQDIEIHYGFEERSSAFFALGRAKRRSFQKTKDQNSNSFVGVFTTSGTAFVETTSALLESYYSNLPLIVVSADRPQRLWGTGAPQTMHQKDLLIHNIGPTLSPKDLDLITNHKPFHINCEFDEPILDSPCSPLVICRF